MGWDYLSRLSRAARWYLPPAEAAEVLEDYREIVAGRSEEELRRDLGTPRAAMRQLAQPKAYRQWLAVFGILSVCLLLPMVDVVEAEFSMLLFELSRDGRFLTNGVSVTSQLTVLLFPAGAVLSFVWFRRTGEKGKALPRRILLLLSILLLGMTWVCFLAWTILTEQWDVLNFLFPQYGYTVTQVLALDILVAEAAGMAGLIKARLGDRRWLAVYMMSLAGAGLAIFLWRMLTCMSYDPSANWQFPYWIRLVFITLVGLLGTGLSLR
ncbi:MAG: hypothetical protein HFF96_02980 [Oscillibacter sp.]|uniref:hypothetical protein n=1 Tax=Oscillibacter sp. TaxID=1945593 RepID=UPI00216DF32F|nr:hypothetical protein [Oscillibacter sp.]MCI9113214.1 hypothetical protein [Oscillibacter sp.]